MSYCNKWLHRSSPYLLPQLPPRRAPAEPRRAAVIGSSNLIYVSLEIEILTFALCSWDFTARYARLGTDFREFYGLWVMAWLE